MFILPQIARQGVESFNAGKYFKCHDELEGVWRIRKGAERDYYHGLIQIAVALYKIKDAPRWAGAVSLLETGTGYLSHVDPEMVELDIVRLIGDSRALMARLKEAGPERLAEFAAGPMPLMYYREGA